ATIYLINTAKAHAFLQGRGYVTPEDVKQVAADVLQHRVIVTYEAEAEDITSADIVRRILDHVEVP
ncbi:MAG: ATPase, partial [Anaerolineae bacterium]